MPANRVWESILSLIPSRLIGHQPGLMSDIHNAKKMHSRFILHSLKNCLYLMFSTDLSWIVLTADNEGFVPLTFEGLQEIIIRDASASPGCESCHSSKTLDVVSSAGGYRKLSSHSLDLATSSMEVLRERSSRSLESNNSSDQASTA